MAAINRQKAVLRSMADLMHCLRAKCKGQDTSGGDPDVDRMILEELRSIGGTLDDELDPKGTPLSPSPSVCPQLTSCTPKFGTCIR